MAMLSRRNYPGSIVLIMLLTAWSGFAHGRTYYVDSRAGNDAWSGVAATDIRDRTNGPWRTLQRLRSIRLQPGDSLVLKCGGVWREPLVISGFGSMKAPITVQGEQGCGETARPEINLAEVLNGWKTDDGEVYSTQVDFQVQQVFVDGQFLDQARFPKNGFLYAESGVSSTNHGGGSTGLVSGRLLGLVGKDARGAKVYIRTVGWKIEEVTAVAIDQTKLQFGGETKFPVRKGAGYYFSGKRWMLDGAPGWYWSPSEKRLYVRLPDGANPDSRKVEAVRYEYGMRLLEQSYVNVSGIRVRHAGLDGVRVEKSVQTRLADLEIVSVGRDGIAFTDGSSGAIEDSVIRESGRDGISLRRSHGVTVSGNRVEKSGTVGAPHNSLAAINATDSNHVLIQRNTIAEAGYIGIRFNRNSLVMNNVVRDTCLVLDDCGAIYSWANTDPRPLQSAVIGNVVENVVGNRAGNPEPWTLAAGIYLDDLSNGVLVSRNTIRQAERGIYLHNAFENTVHNNTVADSRAYGLLIGYGHASYSKTGLRANILRSNILVSANGVPFVYYLDSMGRDFSDVLDGNVYVGGSGDAKLVVQHQGTEGNSYERFSVDEYRRLPGKENHGLLRSTAFPPSLLFNASTQEQSFTCPFSSEAACARATDPDGHALSWPVRLAPFTSLVVLH